MYISEFECLVSVFSSFAQQAYMLTYLCFISILNVFNRFARFNRELYIHFKWRVTRFRLHVIHPYLWLCLSEYVKYEKIQYIPLDINCFLFIFSVVYFHIRINTAQKVYRSVGAFFLKWNKNRSIKFSFKIYLETKFANDLLNLHLLFRLVMM